MEWNLFDPQQEYSVEHRNRPHWDQWGAICFITFRLKDSLPKEVVQRWKREQSEWLKTHGIESANIEMRDLRNQIPKELYAKYLRHFQRQREMELDRCHGECLLRERQYAEIVAKSIRHFDGERYFISDFVIMPNHVHVLCAMNDTRSIKKQYGGWMKYTATMINRKLNRRGALWQDEGFDHLVRNPEQLSYLRQYISDNGSRAGLGTNDYLLYQYDVDT